MKNKSGSFDRSVFFAGTHAEVRRWHLLQMRELTVGERLRGAWEHTCRIYGIDPDHPPPFDRTVFSMRKHDNHE